ncbi:4Fe-4S dicluster domain-containing protein [Deinococcus maricopensis]|uniref:Ferredoxin n=1 Tax=Deinococcus maricopensis (strain DSM 21211 / LMG 22137 / NRRL B-23946 / LB-34) TaxID=709986 RepID=E8UBL3_DEIML|nr:4Fe-4S binding protein [Deinococcus maricopensis]ADV68452.1 4Fe-4S ferredoxin iron-sulfur binding domain-containing protein [Deinococcus maricopensis DSM 21211]
MAYVITDRCAGVRDGACREVCPKDCIHDAGAQFVIDPEECIDCGACVVACPVGAIAHEDDLVGAEGVFAQVNRAFFGR